MPVKPAVTWRSISQDQMQRLSIGDYCATVANAMRQMCANDDAFKPCATRFARIICQFGGTFSLYDQNGTTVFTTEESAPNQDDFVRQSPQRQSVIDGNAFWARFMEPVAIAFAREV